MFQLPCSYYGRSFLQITEHSTLGQQRILVAPLQAGDSSVVVVVVVVVDTRNIFSTSPASRANGKELTRLTTRRSLSQSSDSLNLVSTCFDYLRG